MTDGHGNTRGEYLCIGKECPNFPCITYFKGGGTLSDWCKYYPGYGYCNSKKYGKPFNG